MDSVKLLLHTSLPHLDALFRPVHHNLNPRQFTHLILKINCREIEKIYYTSDLLSTPVFKRRLAISMQKKQSRDTCA